MALGGRSLHEACAKERLAGHSPRRVRAVLRKLASSLAALHASGRVHGDVKQRNILAAPVAAARTAARAKGKKEAEVEEDEDEAEAKAVVDEVTGEEDWVVCDLEASVPLGAPLGRRTSTAYAPPELARALAAAASEAAALGSPVGTGNVALAGVSEEGLEEGKRENEPGTVAAAASFDSWGFGVVAFELCAGRPLWAQDTSDDALVGRGDWAKLCCWHTASDGDLADVFAWCRPQGDAEHSGGGGGGAGDEAEAEAPRVAAARHLIRWCLKGDPAARPTLEEALAHPFLRPEGVTEGTPAPPHLLPPPLALQPLLPVRHRFFVSHCQADSSGAARALYHGLGALGCSCWLDMEEADLTLEGMRAGVRASDVCLAVLSRHYLGSWFCQQELLEAIACGVSIALVVEREERFFPFDEEAWGAGRSPAAASDGAAPPTLGTGERIALKAGGAGWAIVPAAVCAAITAGLASAVTFRRRDFEAAALFREVVCRFAGVALPPPNFLPPRPGAALNRNLNNPASAVAGSRAAPGRGPFGPRTVLVLHRPATGGGILAALKAALARGDGSVSLSTRPADLGAAHRVLVLLTPGVLSGAGAAEGGREEEREREEEEKEEEAGGKTDADDSAASAEANTPLGLLEQCLAADSSTGASRLCFLFSPQAGWAFGCAEHRAAPPAVVEALNMHEALAWRPPDPRGPDRHEFPALLRQLLRRLGLGPSALRQ